MPAYANDLMLAILGSSVGLGGLLLVFCGYVFAQAEGFDPEHTDDDTIKAYRKVARVGLLPFCGSIANAIGVVLWFVNQKEWLYAANVWVFVLLLAVTAVYGVIVFLRYL